jgi:hypothetical protein
MSQRLKAGFNWPPLAIPAEEPVSRVPEAVSLAGPSSVVQAVMSASLTRQAQPCLVPCFSFCPLLRPVVSWACGVVQPDRAAAMFSVMFLAIGS